MFANSVQPQEQMYNLDSVLNQSQMEQKAMLRF